jgi:hypothetical protein
VGENVGEVVLLDLFARSFSHRGDVVVGHYLCRARCLCLISTNYLGRSHCPRTTGRHRPTAGTAPAPNVSAEVYDGRAAGDGFTSPRCSKYSVCFHFIRRQPLNALGILQRHRDRNSGR